MTEDLADVLGEVPLFAPLSAERRAEVAATAHLVRVAAGSYLFRSGDLGDTLYLVVSGRLEVVGDGGRVLSVLGRGDALGELALLTGDVRSASVRAVRDSELAAIDRAQFRTLLEGNAQFAVALTTALGHRLAGSARPAPPKRDRRSILAVVPLVDRIDVAAAVDHLVRTIGDWGRVCALDVGVADPERDDDSHLGRLLDRHEQEHDAVVLVVEMRAPARWRDFCLRQADRVLALTDAKSRPDPTVTDGLRGCDLAFWTPHPPAASRSRPWLDDLQPRARHWVPAGAETGEGLARVARRVFGQSFGVVMSGGGARGLAHAGVVAGLLEGGVVIDRFGGASMGACVSALFAEGREIADIEDVLRREFAEQRPFGDYTIPRVALIRARRARRMFDRTFGDRQIEELPFDWFGVTSDLVGAESIVHRRGPVWAAVGASMSLPGLAPPVPWGHRLLVDGGVLNNLPVDVMASTDEGPVIGIEVMRRWGDKWTDRLAETPGRGASRPALPSLVETLSCATGLGSWRAVDSNREQAALIVQPDVVDIGLLEWARIDEIIERGRLAAKLVLDAGFPSPASPW